MLQARGPGRRWRRRPADASLRCAALGHCRRCSGPGRRWRGRPADVDGDAGGRDREGRVSAFDVALDWGPMSEPPPASSSRATGTFRVKRGLAEMLKGGVIMDVVTPD